MKRRILSSTFAAAILLSSSTAFGQVPAAAPVPTPTLWSFLGIPQGAQKVQGALFNRRGNTPRLEPDTPMRALNDPRNLFSEVPAIKKAAQIKQAEDLKPQKIKSIKYLASIGCGCYDKDGSVTDALIAAAEDCTEDVRLQTMESITESANNKCCSNCGQICCCNEKLMMKLAEIAYERDDAGCYKEPSARVRTAAAGALRACCHGGTPPLIESKIPKEEVEPDVKPESETEEDKDVVPEGEEAKADEGPTAMLEVPVMTEEVVVENVPAELVTAKVSDRAQLQATHLVPVPTAKSENKRPTIAQMRSLMQQTQPPALSTPNPEGGVVMSFEKNSKTAYVHFEDRNLVMASGTELYLRPDPVYSRGFHGSWQVVESSRGCAILVPMSNENIEEVTVGDHVMLGAPPVLIAPVSYSK